MAIQICVFTAFSESPEECLDAQVLLDPLKKSWTYRNGAHGKTDKHKSMVVASSA
jgi:hypothetical protein